MIARLYLFISLPIIVFGVIVLGPFQSPDESNHFFRAYQISQGEMVGSVEAGRSGGRIDRVAVAIVGSFGYLNAAPDKKVSTDVLSQARAATWSGDKVMTRFTNTVIYPPFFYVPSALAIKISRMLGLSIWDSLIAARSAQAAASLILVAMSLCLIRSGTYTVFAISSLPMTLSLFGSASQDGPLFGSIAVMIALLSRESGPGGRAVVALIAGAVIAARPPYLPILLLMLSQIFTAQDHWRDRAIVAAPWIMISLTIAGIWIVFGYLPTSVPFRADDGVSSGQQAALIINQPFAFPMVLIQTFHAFGYLYYQEFIAVLGWLDTRFPPWVIVYYSMVLGGAVLLDLMAGGSKWLPIDRAIVASVAIAAGVMIMGALYLGYTPVGRPVIEGVQGRYFLAIALIASLAIVGRRVLIAPDHLLFQGLRLAVISAPAMGWIVVTRGIFVRYLG